MADTKNKKKDSKDVNIKMTTEVSCHNNDLYRKKTK
jgi:hypothetical protein